MKLKKVVSLFLAALMLFGTAAVLSSCDISDIIEILEEIESLEDPTESLPDNGLERPSTDSESVENEESISDIEIETESKFFEEDKDIVHTSISLPSPTARGNYLSTNTPTVTIGSDVKSTAAVLVDLSTGQAIAGKEADTRIYPASMTKVMTLLVACEKATEGGRLLTVEPEMVTYAQEMGASGNLGFVAGDKISVEDALYLINYRSDTISCLMIAKYVAGSEAAFVDLMNAKANVLGLTGTHFVNTTGLHSEDHYTTCREMAAIMNCAMNNPVAKKILTSYAGRNIGIYNSNYEKYRNPVAYSGWYSDRLGDSPKVSGTDIKIIGGKTGYEDIPTATFVTVAQDTSTQKQYVCVVAGRTNVSQNSISSSQSTTDTRNIYKNYIKTNS